MHMDEVSKIRDYCVKTGHDYISYVLYPVHCHIYLQKYYNWSGFNSISDFRSRIFQNDYIPKLEWGKSFGTEAPISFVWGVGWSIRPIFVFICTDTARVIPVYLTYQGWSYIKHIDIGIKRPSFYRRHFQISLIIQKLLIYFLQKFH